MFLLSDINDMDKTEGEGGGMKDKKIPNRNFLDLPGGHQETLFYDHFEIRF